MAPDPPERPDSESDLVFVDDADEARKPKPPRGSQRAQRPPSSERAPAQPPPRPAPRPPQARQSSGSHPTTPRRRPSGKNRRPASGQHRRPPSPGDKRETRRLGRKKPRPSKGSQSVRIQAPSFDRVGPDPHLRIDGDTSGRPYCLVSPVLDEPLLLSRERSAIVGRAEGVEVRVRSHMISREHAEVRWSGAGFEVRDLGSTNGTFVNGYQLRQAVPLRDGDAIQVGNFEIEVKALRPGEDPEGDLQGMTRPFRVPKPKD